MEKWKYSKNEQLEQEPKNPIESDPTVLPKVACFLLR